MQRITAEVLGSCKVTYSPRGPGYFGYVVNFQTIPSPREIAKALGIVEGTAHFERIIDGSYTVEETDGL